jgi:triphosphoribosyl-dephospho-CoA synthetase
VTIGVDALSRHCRVTFVRPYARQTTEEMKMQRTSDDRKERLYATFAAALDHLDAARREPDRWEEECLSYALGAMACGMYLVAEVELAAFARCVEERSPEVLAALAAKPARFTKEMLRHGVDYVRDRYGRSPANEDMPPAVVAGRHDFQLSMTA